MKFSISQPINFVKNNGKINQQKLKCQIDRRIDKILFLSSSKIEDISDKFAYSNAEIQTSQITKIKKEAETKRTSNEVNNDQDDSQINQPFEINFGNIKRTESLMATYQNLNKKEFNTQRNPIQENPENQKSQNNSDDLRMQIQKSRDSKFFNQSNIQLEHLFIHSSHIKQNSANLDSKCVEIEDTKTISLFQNISMKSSLNMPPNQIVTPMKNLKESNIRNSILKSSIKCAKNLFETSFIDEQNHHKKDSYNNFNKQMKKSFCPSCSKSAQKKVCPRSSRKNNNQKVFISQSCKQNVNQVIKQFSHKIRKETNGENKVRQNIIKRVLENNYIIQN